MSDAIDLNRRTEDTWSRERIDLVKRTVCPKGITDDEFALFIEQCKRSGLDPLIKEAYCVPRRKNIGSKESPKWITSHEFQPSEGGMLARAEKFPDYDGVMASAVYSEDVISVDAGAGQVSHTFNPKKRGALYGAWARLQPDGRVPIVVWLDLAAYAQNTSTWGKMPATMIEKCARVAALRKAFPSAFGGLYIREEMPEEFVSDALPAQTAPVSTGSRTAQVKTQIAAKTSSLIVDVQAGETEDQATTREAMVPRLVEAARQMPATVLVSPTPVTAKGLSPWERCQELGKKYGLDDARLRSRVKGATGKTKPADLTYADVVGFEQSLATIPP